MENTTISVTGRGVVHLTPDVMRIDVSIRRVFKDYAAAYEAAKGNNNMLTKILAYNKIDTQKGKTVKIDIEDHHKSVYDKYGKYVGSELDGYELEQCLRVDIGLDKELANNLIKGIGKYIFGAQISLGYTLRDLRPAQLKILERAVKDAKEKATIMASALGCSLGNVQEIQYGVHDIHIFAETRNYHNNDEAKASTSESLDITPEDLSLADDVKVSWFICNSY